MATQLSPPTIIHGPFLPMLEVGETLLYLFRGFFIDKQVRVTISSAHVDRREKIYQIKLCRYYNILKTGSFLIKILIIGKVGSQCKVEGRAGLSFKWIPFL